MLIIIVFKKFILEEFIHPHIMLSMAVKITSAVGKDLVNDIAVAPCMNFGHSMFQGLFVLHVFFA